MFLKTLFLGLALTIETIHGCSTEGKTKDVIPTYWVLSNTKNANLMNKKIKSALKRFGYQKPTNKLSCSHDYPFLTIDLRSLNKKFRTKDLEFTMQNFAISKSKNIPKSFILPEDGYKLLKYASENKNALVVERNMKNHKKVLKNVTDVDTKGEKVVQEVLRNPFLVEGYKFDIGVFVVITSVNPLRMYYYSGDVLLRFCREKYYPFDPQNVTKYMAGDNMRKIWEVPVVDKIHKMGYSMKDSLDFYLRARGRDPEMVWENIFNVVRYNLVNKEKHITEGLKHIPLVWSHLGHNSYSARQFFVMLRVDLILDDHMKVYLMDANLSPLIMDPSFQLLNDQVLYNLFSIVGLNRIYRDYSSSFTLQDCDEMQNKSQENTCVKNKAGAEMLATDKNIAVWGTKCLKSCHKKKCNGICAVCQHCLSTEDRLSFLEAYREHLRKGDFKRLFPPPMVPKDKVNLSKGDYKYLTPKNLLMYLWYQGKCNDDLAWCY